MIVEFLLQNSFLAAATLFLGAATMYMWMRPGDKVSLDTHGTVMLINNDNAVVVDIRPKAEFDSGHVPGARQMGKDEISNKAEELAKKRPIVIVCANGMLAAQTARKLRADGIEKVTALKGGMRSWLESGQATHRRKK